MNILAIVQEAINRVGIQSPTSLFTTTDSTALQALAFLREECRDLSQKQWQVNQREFTFNTVAAQLQTTIPADQGFIVNDTMWNRTLKRPVFGPLNAQKWQQNKAFFQSGPWSQYRIENNQINFYPSPGAGQAVYYEYISNRLGTNLAGADITDFSSDLDTPVFDNELLILGVKLRFKNEKGLDTTRDFAAYNTRLNTLLSQNATKTVLSMDGQSYDVLPGIFIPAGSWPL